jgi:hypothetical protein
MIPQTTRAAFLAHSWRSKGSQVNAIRVLKFVGFIPITPCSVLAAGGVLPHVTSSALDIFLISFDLE